MVRHRLTLTHSLTHSLGTYSLAHSVRRNANRMGCRCFWDQNTDNYAEETYMNEHLFCVAAAFGIYYY